MNEIKNICPNYGNNDITLNSQVNPVQDVYPGKKFTIVSYPKYLCKECSKEFDE